MREVITQGIVADACRTYPVLFGEFLYSNADLSHVNLTFRTVSYSPRRDAWFVSSWMRLLHSGIPREIARLVNRT